MHLQKFIDRNNTFGTWLKKHTQSIEELNVVQTSRLYLVE